MDSKVGLDGNRPFVFLDNASNNQIKEQVSNKVCAVASVMPLVSNDSQLASRSHQTSVMLRKYSSLDYCGTHLFEFIKEAFLENVGINVDTNHDKLIFNLTKKVCNDQEDCFKYHEYHYLIGEVFRGTDIPDLMRAEWLIPIVQKGDSENQLIVEFKAAPQAYVHTLDGEEMPLKTLPVAPFYNSQALSDVDTSMLRVGIFNLGITDGSPRYIFTTGLGPCLCVALFDKGQNKVLLGHFGADDFAPENLSEIFKFCDEQKMRNLQCHIVGGEYEYLGMKNGFLDLIDFLSSKGVSIKQMFVGANTDRPEAVVVDTRDMTLYGLPFKSLDYPMPLAEINRSKKNLNRIARMPLLTKEHSLSLLTSGEGA